MPKISKTAYAGTELYDNGELSSIALEELASAAGYTDNAAMSAAIAGGTTLNASKFGTYEVKFCGMDWWPVQLAKSGEDIVLTLWLKTPVGNYTWSDGTRSTSGAVSPVSNNYQYSWIRSAINMGQTKTDTEDGDYYGLWDGTNQPTLFHKDEAPNTSHVAPTAFTAFSSIVGNSYVMPGGDYDDYLWLPSLDEAKFGGTWGCTSTQLKSTGASTYCWTRSPYPSTYDIAYSLTASGGTDNRYYVYGNYGVRPAINVNLSVVADISILPDKPTEDTTTFTYNGSVQTYNPVGFDEETMEITGNEQNNAGTYTVTVSPIDGVWSDGDTEPVTFAFTINKAKPTFTLGSVEDSYETTSGLPENIYTFSTNGTFKWTTDTPTAGTNDYYWTFTPTDSLNYETVSDKISLTFTEPVVEPDPDNPDPDNPDPDNPDPDNPSGGSGSTGGDNTDDSDPNNPGGSGTTDPTDPNNPGGSGSGSGSTGDNNDPNNPGGSGSGSGSTGGDNTDDNDPDNPGGSGSGSGSTGGDNTDDNDPSNPGGSGSGSGSTGGDNTDDNDPNNPGGSGSGSGSTDGDNTDDNDPNNPGGSGSDNTDPSNPDNNDGNDDVNGGGSTDSDNNSKENNTSGAGATEMLNKIKDFMSKPVAGLALWLWILIAIAALIMLIIIIAIAKKHSKNKEQREEIKARKAEEKARRDEERQRREEERRLQREKLDAERELARARQEAELEKIRAQAGLAGMGAASMAMQQQPVQQLDPSASLRMTGAQPQPIIVNGGSDNSQVIAQLKAEVAELRARQNAQQPNYAPPQYAPAIAPAPQPAAAPAWDSVTLARLEAQLNAMQAEQRARYEAEQHAEQNSALKTELALKNELEMMKLRLDQRQPSVPQQIVQSGGVSVDGELEKIVAVATAVWRNMQAQQNAEVKPAQSAEDGKAYPPDAVVTTTTTVDTTKNKPIARSREKQSEFTDVDGFYDKYE